MRKHGFLIQLCLAASMAATAQSYRVETIAMPEGLTAEVGAVAFLPNGRLIASFTRGEVMIRNMQTGQWSLFAEGLHDPLGILVISNNEVLVMQRPELTRLKDTDGDGSADVYECVTDDFGLSGNYHEFNYGPVRDKQGNLYIALNSSSPGGGMRPEVRGKINVDGRDGVDGQKQMFSAVPYRGWIMQLTPAGKLLPYASGFRSPNGIGFDLEGNLFATDNQGDWIGTSPLLHVQRGKFYGHPGSLVWRKGWKGNPFQLPVEKLDSLRTKPAVIFPHGIMANSPTEPLADHTRGKFGPFAGQLLIGEMNTERIVRVMLEKVDGVMQGACVPFLDGHGLRKGNNRLSFAPDGSLYVGQNSHGWLGAEGIQRIVYTGTPPLDVLKMQLTATGFDLVFTQPVDPATAAQAASYQFRRYNYTYHKKYGSHQFNVSELPVRQVKLSPDRRRVSVRLDAMAAGYVYELKLQGIRTTGGQALANSLVCYTVNRLVPGAAAPAVKSVPFAQKAIQEGKLIMSRSDCHACHKPDTKLIGPAYADIARKYKPTEANVRLIADKIIKGGSGVWGNVPMAPHANLSVQDTRKIAQYILSL
ncbi:DUF7133 domain-containing protein [Chitinophaga lutea]